MATALLLPATWINVTDLEEAEAELQRAGFKTTKTYYDYFLVFDDEVEGGRIYVSNGDQLVILPPEHDDSLGRIVVYNSIPHRWIAF